MSCLPPEELSLEKKGGKLSTLFSLGDKAGRLASSPLAVAHGAGSLASSVASLPGISHALGAAASIPGKVINTVVGKPLGFAAKTLTTAGLGAGSLLAGVGKGISGSVIDHAVLPAARFAGRQFAKAPITSALTTAAAVSAGGQVLDNLKGAPYAKAFENVYGHQGASNSLFGRRTDPVSHMLDGGGRTVLSQDENEYPVSLREAFEKIAVSEMALRRAIGNRLVRNAKDPTLGHSKALADFLEPLPSRSGHALDIAERLFGAVGSTSRDARGWLRSVNNATLGKNLDSHAAESVLNSKPAKGMAAYERGMGAFNPVSKKAKDLPGVQYPSKKETMGKLKATADDKANTELAKRGPSGGKMQRNSGGPGPWIGLIGLGGLGAAAFSPTGKTIGEKMQKKFFPNVKDRINAEDEIAKSEVKGYGEFRQKEVMRKLERARKQKEVMPAAMAVIHGLSKKDPVIAEAHKDPKMRDVIHQTMNTVYAFGPHVARDPRAMQSILREAISSPDGGLSFQTVKQITETQKNIAQSNN